jgi:hypothetical protein
MLTHGANTLTKNIFPIFQGISSGVVPFLKT